MLESWGRYPKSEASEILSIAWKSDSIPQTDKQILPYGQGRSYGDVCLNDHAALLVTKSLNKFILFDKTSGILRCEAGVTIAEILKVCAPNGWFIPVTPGTKFVSIGGAIANDVHGKNHHIAGTFGCHVKCFELLRSDGSRLTCSSSTNSEYFNATIGGMGLTGLITWAEIQLKPIKGPYIEEESIKFRGLGEFFDISKATDSAHEYTVAWLDCVASGSNFARGIFMRGRHSTQSAEPSKYFRESKFQVPFNFPSWALNNLSVKAFNFLYYNKQLDKVRNHTVHYEPFFYPLDSVLNWNRIYGQSGFLQFQCAIPNQDRSGEKAIEIILKEIVKDGSASFLAVLKEFGDIKSPGIMSFPQPGITLCLDFSFRGNRTIKLMERLYAIVIEHSGRIYPAKDSCMSPEIFRKSFPNLEEFTPYMDPKFSSQFWRRAYRS